MPEIDFANWTCPLPLRDYANIVIGHGGGGKLSAELVEHLFLPAFKNDLLENLGDSTVFNIPAGRLAFSTDSYVVHPLFFPGGNIGELAVNGTVNDLAMSGATPLYLSAGFIIEEGLPMETLGSIANCMGAAARAAGVQIVTGDTKVVDRGHGDGVFINTAGIGRILEGISIAPHQARPSDIVIISGTLGDHGMAVMSVREGLEFGTEIRSDTAALNSLVAAMLAASAEIHVLRDPTRGGLATTLNEIAEQSQVNITIEEKNIPVKPAVQTACEMLGFDPLYVANEGKLIVIVPENEADAALDAMKNNRYGVDACRIGRVMASPAGRVLLKTQIGATRVLDVMAGEMLPRIC